MEGKSPESEQRIRNAAFDSESAASLVLLHVDDNPDDRTLFQEALRHSSLPLECTSVDSAAKAIAHLEGLLQQRSAEHTRWPDLVVLAWALAGQSGPTMLQYIRRSASWQTLPVIVLTGDQDPKIRDEVYRLGANSCLRKPLRFDQMVEMTRAIHLAWTWALRPRPPAAKA